MKIKRIVTRYRDQLIEETVDGMYTNTIVLTSGLGGRQYKFETVQEVKDYIDREG